MSNKDWGSVPYLDALRPDYGWHVEYAVLSSYSADLYALVAAMLALGGVDDDRGSGSKVDFANGLERLSNRLRLVVQSGRLVAPRKAPKILALLDQYIREVPFDEKDHSWHPKIALVKTRSNETAEVEWRLWIGSRNLTRDMSWDVGLALAGKQGGEGVAIEGVPELGASLARRADLSGFSAKDVQAELHGILWRCPDGCDLHQIRLHDDPESRSLPSPPTELKRLLVISPFLDGKIVGMLSKWGPEGVSRVLLSTKPELLKLAHQKARPLDGFTELLSLTAPDSDEVIAMDADTAADVKSEDEEPEPRGLHSKLILAEHAGGITMWLGSANATTRGWSGPNAEVIAEASVSNTMAEGLDEFVKEFGATVQVGDLEDIPEEDDDRDRLEIARTQVAARWSVAQQFVEDVAVLTTNLPPHPDDSAIHLHVAGLTASWVEWPRDAISLKLAPVPAGEASELIACKLSLGETQMCWLQRAPMNPPPGEDRDRKALSRYLDPRTFLQWLRSLLAGTSPGDGGGDWDSDKPKRTHDGKPDVGPTWWSPTLEEVLKAWSRDPASLKEVDRKTRYYLKLYHEREADELSVEERKVIQEFEQMWAIVRLEMVKEDHDSA